LRQGFHWVGFLTRLQTRHRRHSKHIAARASSSPQAPTSACRPGSSRLRARTAICHGPRSVHCAMASRRAFSFTCRMPAALVAWCHSLMPSSAFHVLRTSANPILPRLLTGIAPRFLVMCRAPSPDSNAPCLLAYAWQTPFALYLHSRQYAWRVRPPKPKPPRTPMALPVASSTRPCLFFRPRSARVDVLCRRDLFDFVAVPSQASASAMISGTGRSGKKEKVIVEQGVRPAEHRQGTPTVLSMRQPRSPDRRGPQPLRPSRCLPRGGGSEAAFGAWLRHAHN
jgi:hypothetical protein